MLQRRAARSGAVAVRAYLLARRREGAQGGCAQQRESADRAEGRASRQAGRQAGTARHTQAGRLKLSDAVLLA